MRRPYVLVNAAVSADGKLARADRSRLRLSNDADLEEVDCLRAEADAILVGSTTLRNDRPTLTVKSRALREQRLAAGKPALPMRVAIDGTAELDLSAPFFADNGGDRFLFVTSRASRAAINRAKGVATVFVADGERVSIPWLLSNLYANGVRKLLVEGGGQTIASFLASRAVDELRIAVAPVLLGGASAPTLADGEGLPAPMPLHLFSVERQGEMVVLRYLKAPKRYLLLFSGKKHKI